MDVIPQLDGGSIPDAAFAARVTLGSPGDSSWVEVAFDTSGIADAYGADYGDRLQFIALPECALTTPDQPECMQGVPLPATRDADGVVRVYAPANSPGLASVGRGYARPETTAGVRSADLAASYAASQGLRSTRRAAGRSSRRCPARTRSPGRSRRRTSRPAEPGASPSRPASFTYSIPIAVPPVSAGPVPNVDLSYSSQSTDGKTFATNAQASIVGEGWSMPTNYIERLYKPCSADGGADDVGRPVLGVAVQRTPRARPRTCSRSTA